MGEREKAILRRAKTTEKTIRKNFKLLILGFESVFSFLISEDLNTQRIIVKNKRMSVK
jgi:hypothetical protein